jgi:hypothetical protein
VLYNAASGKYLYNLETLHGESGELEMTGLTSINIVPFPPKLSSHFSSNKASARGTNTLGTRSTSPVMRDFNTKVSSPNIGIPRNHHNTHTDSHLNKKNLPAAWNWCNPAKVKPLNMSPCSKNTKTCEPSSVLEHPRSTTFSQTAELSDILKKYPRNKLQAMANRVIPKPTNTGSMLVAGNAESFKLARKSDAHSHNLSIFINNKEVDVGYVPSRSPVIPATIQKRI